MTRSDGFSKLAVTGLLWLLALNADAGLISTGSRFGPDTITRDLNTGLEWLDLDQSTLQGYEGVTAELGPGGVYEGFRVASLSEVETLFFSSAGIDQLNPSSTLEEAEALIDLVSVTGAFGTVDPFGCGSSDNPCTNFISYGWADDGGDDTELGFARLSINYSCGLCGVENILTLRSASTRFGSIPQGFTNTAELSQAWLVREVREVREIPAPETLGLIGLGILGLRLCRKA